MVLAVLDGSENTERGGQITEARIQMPDDGQRRKV